MKRGYTVEHEAMWQRPAKCEKVNFFYPSFPDFHSVITKVAHVGLFANVASNWQTSSSHFLYVPFILGGKHQLPPLYFSLDSLFSFVHLIKPCSFPPQITSSGPSRQQPQLAIGRWRPEGAELSR